MKNIILTSLLVMLSFFKVSAQEVKRRELVSSTLFNKQITVEKVQLVDVRTPKEYDEGTIFKAINIDYLSDDFGTAIEKLDKTRPVYIFCQSGKRSAGAAKKIIDAGFNVIELAGGYKAWKAEND